MVNSPEEADVIAVLSRQDNLHFEIDYLKNGVFTLVDPYGWHPAVNPSAIDPYSNSHPGLPNMTLWEAFIP
jgi:hypothetical protein